MFLFLYDLSDTLGTLCNVSLPFVDVHIVRMGGSRYIPKSYSECNRGGGCKIFCEHFSYMAYSMDLKLCTVLHSHLMMFTLF